MKKNYALFFFLIVGAILSVQTEAFAYKDTIVVAKDGSGDFTSIQKAVESCKSFPYATIRIFIRNGVYHEKVRIPAWNTRISMIGENKDSTIITYGDYFSKINRGPNSTFYTATLLVQGRNFLAENLTIENSAGPVGQAIALDLEADGAAIVNCRILGNQDTVYCAGALVRLYFRGCLITGTTDFIFGEATALFEKCKLVIKGNSFFTAASTPPWASYGFVFRECLLTGVPGVTKASLGRPWRRYAKTVFIRCRMDSCIAPAGWNNWRDTANERTVLYAEFQSRGPGANPDARVPWSRQLTAAQASEYTPERIFAGTPSWNPASVIRTN